MQHQGTNKQQHLQQKQDVLIVHNQQCLLHNSSRKHPELPFRITAILDALKHVQTLSTQELVVSNKVKDIPGEELEKLIAKVHGQRYHEFIQYMWDQASKKSEMYISTDTYYMKHTYQAASAAVKTSLLAIDAILSKQYRYAYAVIRPPGHHSGLKNQPHGFSFFNNVGIAAEYALRSNQFQKIAIVDWDAHHGQGTQNLFYKRKDILYISLHRYDNGKFFPHIPNSSSLNCGEDDGLGFNINICWNLPEKKANTPYNREESVGDEEYASAFRKIVMPVLQVYAPDLLLISCGFDSGDGDTIGNLKISKHGYGFMTRSLKSLNKPMLAVLQGGYNPDVLSWGSQAVVDGLLGKEQDDSELKSKQGNKIGEEGISSCLQQINKWWKLL